MTTFFTSTNNGYVQGYRTMNAQIAEQSTAIEQTKSYQMFKFDKSNRPIDQRHLSKLTEAIRNRNLLKEFPILVTVDYVVIDGQHRLRAAEQLNVPIFYTVTENMTASDAASVNNVAERWTSADWMHSWIAQGKQEYVKFSKFLQRYPWMAPSIAANLVSYGDRAQRTKKFSNGTFACNDLEFAERVAHCVLDFKPHAAFYQHSAFIGAVACLLEHAAYDHERMMARLEYASRKMVKCPDVPGYLEMFEDIYNYRTREAFRAEFKVLTSNSLKRDPARRFRKDKTDGNEAAA